MSDLPFDPAEPDDPLVGALLQDRYRVIRKLGAGGMGVVYEGEHVRIRKRVAIKCLHAQFAKNRDVLARFHREALAATAIGNEHIVEVTDLDQLANGTVFLVLEYLDGRDLGHDFGERGRLPVARAVHIVSQMCEALAIAHDKGIIHRDIKPDNVFLVTRGGDPDFVKILDFGISKFRDVEEASHGVTDTGSMLGTPLYMAPEQFSDTKTVDRRADIYAIGGILFHALTGRTAYRGKTLSALIGEVMHGAPPDLRAHRPDLPEELARVVHRMLARKPEERFDDCDAVRIALRPFARLAERPALLHDSLTEPRDDSAAPNITPASLLFAAADGGTSADPVPPAPALTTSGTGVSPSTSLFLQSVKVRPAWMMAAAGGLALAAVLGIALGARERRTTPVASGPVVPVTPLAPTPAGPTPTPMLTPTAVAPAAPAAAAVAREVRIRIRSTPPDAELYFDSHRMMNPFDGELPADVRPHRLEARRAGYRTVVIPDLVLEFPQNVEIPMTRGSGEDRRATRPQQVGGNGPAVVVAAPIAERPVPTAPSPAAPATPAVPAAAPTPPPVETPAPFVPPPPAIRDPI